MMQSEIMIKEDKKATVSEYNKYFPTFTWVLKDFSLEFKHMTPKSYINQCLDPDPKTDPETAQMNNIRRCIKDFFAGEKDLDCHWLVKPIDGDDSKLERIDE